MEELKKEAPDKIYLNKYMFKTGMFYKAQNPITPDIEYIRKDALLEWANNWKKLGQSEDFLYGMETLVQHLNSM